MINILNAGALVVDKWQKQSVQSNSGHPVFIAHAMSPNCVAYFEQNLFGNAFVSECAWEQSPGSGNLVSCEGHPGW